MLLGAVIKNKGDIHPLSVMNPVELSGALDFAATLLEKHCGGLVTRLVLTPESPGLLAAI